MSGTSWCGVNVIQFNYGIAHWNMFPRQSGRVSFFWKGVMSSLPALRGCILQGVNTRMETPFWKDHWVNGCAPMFLCLEEFRRSQAPNGTIRELLSLFDQVPFSANSDIRTLNARLRGQLRTWGIGNGGGLQEMVLSLLNPFITS